MTLQQVKSRKYVVLKHLLSLKLINYLTPITEQQFHIDGIMLR